MNNLVNQQAKYSMAWTPAPLKSLPPPAFPDRSMGQSTALGEPASVMLVGDTLVAGSAALFAWSLHTQESDWSTFWWVVAGMAFVKGLHDASNI